MTASVVGQLVFSQKNEDGREKPVHNVVVQFVYKGPLGTELCCNRDASGAEATTDMEGRFEIVFVPRWFRVRSARLRILRREIHYRRDGRAAPHDLEASGNHPLTEYSLPETGIFDFGVQRINMWEYDHTGLRPTPRLKIDDENPLSQEHRFGRLLRKRKAEVTTAICMNPITYSFFEPINETKRMRKNCTGAYIARGCVNPDSDSYMVEMALNGFNPCLFKRGDDGRYFVDFKWGGVMQDGHHFAPDTCAFFCKEGPEEDPVFCLESIQLQKRRLKANFTPAENAEMEEPDTYTPSDGELWERAKRVWRNDYFLWGEVFTHLGSTHLNCEQYILPFERNIQKSPIRNLLSPHFHGCVTINQTADKMILGENGFLVQTAAVTALSAGVGLRAGFDQYNWHDWSPRAALSSDHRFARIQELFWEVLGKYCDYYFAEHLRGIEAHWAEVLLFSQELVNNAVPYTDNAEPWVCCNEINKASSPHPEVHGRRVAISPITLDKCLTEANRTKNLANLKQLCKYLIFQCTLKHGYVNDRQFDLGGDPDFASLGLRKDITDMSVNVKDALTPQDKRMHIVLTQILSKMEYGYLMYDEDSDIHPELKRLLGEQRNAFMKLGQNIDNIRSCINI